MKLWEMMPYECDSAKKDYYENLDTSENPFNWIQVVPLVSPEIQKKMGYDHAGPLETSLMLAAAGNRVGLSRLKGDGLWFTKGAESASAEHCAKTIEMIVEYLTGLAR